TVHQAHMPEIALTSPTTATGIWALFDWVDEPERGRAFQSYGHYHEEYQRGADGNWLITSLRVTRIRFVDMPPTPISEIARRNRQMVVEMPQQPVTS
ncbi:MAG: nuclear transport factor 2 family protein, partial [Hyphomicrobiaceae bacterium]